MIKIGKFVDFWAGNSCHLVRDMKKEYVNFPFSLEIILKPNFIVISISLYLVNICQSYIGLY